MFDLNRWPILWPIVAPIQIKHIHSSISYQQATHQKYDRCGDELPSGYGPLNSDLILEGLGQDENKKEDPVGTRRMAISCRLLQPLVTHNRSWQLTAANGTLTHAKRKAVQIGGVWGRVGPSIINIKAAWGCMWLLWGKPRTGGKRREGPQLGGGGGGDTGMKCPDVFVCCLETDPF